MPKNTKIAVLILVVLVNILLIAARTLQICRGGDGSPVKRKDIVEMLHKEYGIRKTNCYDLVKKAIITGIIVEIDRTEIKLNP